MRLRPASPEDFPRLTAIWKAAVEATHDFVSAEEIAGYEARMPAEFLPAVEVTVAENETGEPLGFVGTDGPKIEMLFVDPASHRQGVGRKLVRHVAASHPVVSVDVNEENPGAIAFYERLGFREEGRSELDQDGNPHPLVHLSLTS